MFTWPLLEQGLLAIISACTRPMAAAHCVSQVLLLLEGELPALVRLRVLHHHPLPEEFLFVVEEAQVVERALNRWHGVSRWERGYMEMPQERANAADVPSLEVLGTILRFCFRDRAVELERPEGWAGVPLVREEILAILSVYTRMDDMMTRGFSMVPVPGVFDGICSHHGGRTIGGCSAYDRPPPELFSGLCEFG